MNFEDKVREIGYKGKVVKTATITKIKNDIYKMYDVIYESSPEGVDFWTMLLDHETVLEALDELKVPPKRANSGKNISLNTKIGYLSSILVTMKSLGQEESDSYTQYQQKYQDLQDQRTVDTKKNPPSEIISREQVDAVVEKNRSNRRLWLLLKLYTTYNFRLEVATLEQISQEEYEHKDEIPDYKERNFIVTGPVLRFVFNKYKTSGKYGERTIMIEDGEFRAYLLEYLKERENSDFIFFEEIQDEEWSSLSEAKEKVLTRLSNNLSKILQRTFKKEGLDLNATKLAKLIESEAARTGDLKLIQKVAHDRGHTVETGSKVYDIVK
jgi:nucleoside diphosphate kinase